MERTKPLIFLKSLIAAYLLTGLLLVILALTLYKFRLGESFINMAVNGIYILACLAGGIASGKACGQRKFLWGLLTGLLYFAVLLTASCAINHGFDGSLREILTVLGICAGSGTLGGMVS